MAEKTIQIDVKVNAPTIKELRNNIQGLEEDIKQATDPRQVKKLEKEIENLNKSIKEVQKSGSDLGATFEEIYGDLQPLSTRIAEAEDRLYELAKAGKANSDEFRNLSIQVAENKKVIMETDMAIDDMANNRGLASFGSQLGGIGQSLMSLDFTRANNQAKAFAMNAKSIDFGGAISQVKNLGGTFMQLGKALLTNPLFLIVAAIVAIGAAIIKLLDKLGLLKVIMNAIGKVFGWISDLIDALIQPLKDLTDWLGWTANAAEESAQKQADAAEKVAKATENRTESVLISIDAEIERAKIQGKNTEDLERKKVYLISFTAKKRAEADKEAYKAAVLKGELDKEEIENLKEKARQSRLAYKSAKEDAKTFEVQVAADKVNAQKDANKKLKEDADAAAKEQAAKNKAAYEARKKQIEEERKFRAQVDKEIEDLKLSLIEDETERELKINELKFKRLREELVKNTQYSEDQRKALKDIYDKQELKASEEINKKKTDAEIERQNEVNTILTELRLTEREKQFADIDAQYAELKKKLTDNATEEFKLTEEYNNAILELDKKAAAEKQAILDEEAKAKKEKDEAEFIAELEKNANTLAGKKALLDEQMRLELENAELTSQQREEIEKKYRDARLAADIAAVQQGANYTKQGLDAIQGLSDAIFANKMQKLEKGSAAELAAAKKQFEINKKLQIAQALIQGVQAVLAAYSSGSAIPVVGAVTGPVFAALAAATVVANIAKIKNSKFEGGSAAASTGGGGSASAASAATPSFNLFGQGNQMNNVSAAQDKEKSQNITINNEVKVSETEITGTQQTVKNIKETSTL
jgi:hypothetical protein